jgi:hypothetical protein
MSRGEVLNLNNLGDWESQIREYFVDLREGIRALNVLPETVEERKEQFTLKRQVVLNLVERVTIDRNRKLKVRIRLDLLKFFRAQSSEIRNNDTCAVLLSADVH